MAKDVKIKVGGGAGTEVIKGIFDTASASVNAFGQISAASIGAFGRIASSAIAAGGSIISAAMANKGDSGDSGTGDSQVIVVGAPGRTSTARPTTGTTAVSKPTITKSMTVNQLLMIMVDQLSSIQSSLHGQIVAENQLAKSEEMATKEAEIEGKRGFFEKIKDTYGSAKGKIKRGGSLILGAVLAAGVLAKLANIKWDDILKIADNAKQLVAGLKETIMKSMEKLLLLGSLVSLIYTGLPGLVLNLIVEKWPFLTRLVGLVSVGALAGLLAATTATLAIGAAINKIANEQYEDVKNTVERQPTLKQYGIKLVKPGVFHIEALKKEFTTENLPRPYDEIVRAYFPYDGKRYNADQRRLQLKFKKDIDDGTYVMDPKTKELKLSSVPSQGRTDYSDYDAAITSVGKLTPPPPKIPTPPAASTAPASAATPTSSMGTSTADSISSASQENNNIVNFGSPPAPVITGAAPSGMPGSGTVGNRSSSTLDAPLDPTFTDSKIIEYFQYFDRVA